MKKKSLSVLKKAFTTFFLFFYTFAPLFLNSTSPESLVSKAEASSSQYVINSVSGIWTSVTGTSASTGLTGLNTNEIRWGNPAYYNGQKSGLKYTNAGIQTFDEGQKFLLGQLTHMNWPVTGSTATAATLQLTLDFNTPNITDPVLTYNFSINETSNSYSLSYCPPFQQSGTPCDDQITFPNAYGSQTFTIGDVMYTLVIDGFMNSYPTGTPVTQFITEESKNNEAYLIGHLSSILVGHPQITLVEKAVNGEDADTAPGILLGIGETANFTYIVQNTGNVTMSNVTVTDDHGLTVTCPKTTLAAGESMTCTASSTAVAGQYTNTAHASGIYNGNTYTSNNESANYFGVGTVNICHATSSNSNPYVTNSPSMTGDVSGHDDHDGQVWYPGITGDWGDIIPPFNYPGGSYSGKNWTAYGQAIWNNACKIPQGTITVNKIVYPSNDNTSFAVALSGTSNISGAPTSLDGNTGSISKNKSETFTVTPGTYSIAETVPSGWTQVSNTCNNISIANGDSKVCTITNTKYSSLTIVKNAVPKSSQDFLFTTTGTGLSNFILDDDTDPTYSNTKVFSNLLPGTYSVTEGSINGWDLTSSICSNGNNPGSITLNSGENVTCTFTNTQRGTISGYKYNDADGSYLTSNDRTGVQGWTIELWQNGAIVESTTTLANGSYRFTNVLPGTYQLKEVIITGWYKLYPTDLTLTVTVTPGQEISNNNFINVKYPSIKVMKDVDNNADGVIDQTNTTDWEWTIENVGRYNTGSTAEDLTPGVYTISEIQKPNYHVTSVTCNNGQIYSATESIDVSLVSGEDLVCTFTNTKDTGKLKIIKQVTNDNGGNKTVSDFSFQINTEAPINFDSTGVYETTRLVGDSLSITEGSHDGYNVSYTNCSNISVSTNAVTTCTITNDDIPPVLTLNKSVTNDNGGDAIATDWVLSAIGNSTLSGAGTVTSNSTFKIGTYTLSESGSTLGYQAGSWSCIKNNEDAVIGSSITLGLGDNAVCTITNNDIAPTLTIVKTVNNTHGGTKAISDFNLYIDGTIVTSGQPKTVTANQEITVSEDQLSGYSASTWGGDCSTDGKITLKPGENKTCTITNNDIAPTLTIIKTVENNYGGTKTVSDFSLHIDGTSVVSGQAVSVEANKEITVSEDQLTGYTASTWSGDCTTDGKITLLPGENKTCTITNSDIQPKLTIVKHVINDNGGHKTAENFIMNVLGSNVTNPSFAGDESGITVGLNAGDYSVDENYASGYTKTLSKDCTGVIGIGEEKTCTITNDDQVGSITIHKELLDQYGNTEDITSEDAFQVFLNNDHTDIQNISDSVENSQVANFGNLDAGAYTVSELPLDGYTFVGCYNSQLEEVPTLTSTALLANTFSLENGEIMDIVCQNQIIEPLLEIEKTNDTAGQEMLPGDIVTYTIKVFTPADEIDNNYKLNNVLVSDLLPAGFSYQNGTWTAQSSVRGDLKATNITTEPEYTNNGTAIWNLGNMTEGEIITLTYQALISTEQDAGTYNDLAWTHGTSLIGENILGNKDNGIFVSTNVKVGTPIEEGDVLGIMDYVTLPNTGASLWILIGAVLSIILGMILVFLKPNKMKKLLSIIASFGILSGFIFLPTQAKALSNNVEVKIEQPASPINQDNFKIGYVAIDLLERPLQVQCYESTYGAFGSIQTTNSGDCLIDPTIVSNDGSYEFYISVTAGAETVISSKVTVTVDSVKPGAVTNYKKTSNNCNNTLTFTTANDLGQTTKVQIFRSNKTEYTAGSSTLIKELIAGSNQNISYTDTVPVCDETYYYAVRALDAAGNSSLFTTDKVIITTIEPSTPSNQNTNNDETTKTSTDTNSTSDTNTDNNQEQTSTDTSEEVKGESTEISNNGIWSWLKYVLGGIGVLIIASGVYVFYARKKKK